MMLVNQGVNKHAVEQVVTRFQGECFVVLCREAASVLFTFGPLGSEVLALSDDPFTPFNFSTSLEHQAILSFYSRR
jgi:hypothetical protein